MGKAGEAKQNVLRVVSEAIVAADRGRRLTPAFLFFFCFLCALIS